jgi:hypothetical protein
VPFRPHRFVLRLPLCKPYAALPPVAAFWLEI